MRGHIDGERCRGREREAVISSLTSVMRLPRKTRRLVKPTSTNIYRLKNKVSGCGMTDI